MSYTCERERMENCFMELNISSQVRPHRPNTQTPKAKLKDEKNAGIILNYGG